MDRLTIFCEIDDFCRQSEPKFTDGTRKRIKSSKMSRAEVTTILVLFHKSGFRDLKRFYTKMVCKYWHKDSRNLLSYNRFVELQKDSLVLLGAFIQTRLEGCSGVSFVDSSKIPVCSNLRIKQNKVVEAVARRGKTSTGWIYGSKIYPDCLSGRFARQSASG